MLLVQVLLPLLLGGLAFTVRSNLKRPWLLPLGGAAHLIGTCVVLIRNPPTTEGAWLGLDPLNKVVLGFLSLLFFLCSVYARGYLVLRPNQPNRIFTASLLAFLGMLTLAVEAQHLGLMWVAVESCTLSSAPLLYFNQNPRSLEATWKYMLIGSVGIALAQATFDSMDEAVAAGRRFLAHGGVLLLSPGAPSFDRYKNWEERSQDFTRAVHERSA